MMKFVTALGVDNAVSCESWSRLIASEEERDVTIQEARDEAVERYEENIGTIPLRHRIVVHATEFPMPKPQQAVAKATRPDLSEEPVTATIG